MVTVKSSQKIFTDSEVATLTGICVDHVHNFAKSRHLGFIARAAEAGGDTGAFHRITEARPRHAAGDEWVRERGAPAS